MHHPIIELRHIRKRFSSTLALDHVSVSIRSGEVHAIVGENGAGKSTLINILAGELQPDSGTVLFHNEPRVLSSPVMSQRLGISVVYQELALCPNLSVAENVCLNMVAGKKGWQLANRRQMVTRAREVLARLGLGQIDLGLPVHLLSVAKQQIVEIAKAITTEVRVLVLDEPNSALTNEESEHLFRIVRQLRSEGITVIYVSHRLDEVLELSDRITVMRDGRVVETLDKPGTTVHMLIEKMVGRDIEHVFGKDTSSTRVPEEALRVRRLSDRSLLRGIDFSLRQGEILGIAGLPGAGKEELVECLFGLRAHTGELRLNGQLARIMAPSEAIRQGMVLIPADRRGAGAMLVMNIRDNIAAANLARVSRFGFLQQKRMRHLADHYMERLDIRASGLGQRMGTLSGGNQQKVILSRGLATEPKVLVLHEPTRGIDVGAKAEIYGILQDLASRGVAVVIISSEMTELIGQCNRIVVLHEGRVTGRLARNDFDEERILACAMGQSTFNLEA